MSKNNADEYNICVCMTCKDQPEFPTNEFRKHLQDVHHTTKMMGERRMLAHIDAKDYFIWEWAWTIGHIEFIQKSRTKRSKPFGDCNNETY